MKTPQNPSILSIHAHVQDLDDATLRSGHALLDASRSLDFAQWLDSRLLELEERFYRLSTPQSRRRAMGR